MSDEAIAGIIFGWALCAAALVAVLVLSVVGYFA